ncbi:hypothetical protein C9374_005234 [Naegleria lovaniensis]|uniref:Transmembrane protein n=1 Tax=Naegleria lovaniensis TaxID=51637 RepID=A0AA88KIB9_NAELO|nr:uncharacterized protein C9374_005234 [Naegleria lovaniensis]KAG2382654.1 hypothetical protein C9374_005234 [Naegleria lovaniensis]
MSHHQDHHHDDDEIVELHEEEITEQSKDIKTTNTAEVNHDETDEELQTHPQTQQLNNDEEKPKITEIDISQHEHDPRFSMDQSDISALSRTNGGDPRRIEFKAPLAGAILNLIYSTVFVILSMMEIKWKLDFIEKYDDHDDDKMDDDQVQGLTLIGVFCLVVGALISLIGSLVGVATCCWLWKKEQVMKWTNRTQRAFVNIALIGAAVWLASTIFSIIPFGALYLIMNCTVSIADTNTVNVLPILGILLGGVFVAFAILLTRRIWVNKTHFGDYGLTFH